MRAVRTLWQHRQKRHADPSALCVKIQKMRTVIFFLLLCVASVSVFGQNADQKIYETERAFEKMVAERGINAAFIEYLTPDGIMFFPEAANAQERWRSRPPSPAALTWNPILIDVASNGVLAYSIGNSVYRAKGKDDPNGFAGHYLTIWIRRPNGEYRAVLDTGINHEKPASSPTDWRSAGSAGDKNEKRLSAADSSTGFFQMAEAGNLSKAFKTFMADNAILMRDGMLPFFGKKAATDHVGGQKGVFKFAKIKSFIEAADLAYVHAGYSVADKAGKETESGNFVQVWKLKNGKWQIVADVLIPVPKAAK